MSSVVATEHWAAQVNAAGWGLGVWTPDTTRISGGFYKESGAGGPTNPPTGYLAPNRQEILDHNIVFDYRYELVLGTLAEIRAHALRHADANRLPKWKFTNARLGWHYVGAGDEGWPIKDELKIRPNPAGQWQIISPEFFLRADQATNLVIEAAFEKTGETISVFSREPGERKSNWQHGNKLAIVPDGQMRRYEVLLKNVFSKSSSLVQLRLDFQTADTNALVRLRSVTFE